MANRNKAFDTGRRFFRKWVCGIPNYYLTWQRCNVDHVKSGLDLDRKSRAFYDQVAIDVKNILQHDQLITTSITDSIVDHEKFKNVFSSVSVTDGDETDPFKKFIKIEFVDMSDGSIRMSFALTI